MVPHVLIQAEPLHTSEPGSSGHHLQHRLDRRPQRVPRDSELSSQARDRGMFTAKLLDRPPTRTHGQTCPRSHDYRVLLREHLLHTRTARRNTRFACATRSARSDQSTARRPRSHRCGHGHPRSPRAPGNPSAIWLIRHRPLAARRPHRHRRWSHASLPDRPADRSEHNTWHGCHRNARQHNIDPGNIEVLRNGVFGRHQS